MVSANGRRRRLRWARATASALTYYTGFRVNSGEYKVMGLAPYGEPKYAQLMLDHLIDLKPDGSFRLDMSYFDYCTGLAMTNERFAKLFGQPVRTPDKLLTPFHMDVNVRGEPIVCTPEDAFRCFMGNELDLLVIGNCVLKKAAQDPALKQDYSSAFELD